MIAWLAVCAVAADAVTLGDPGFETGQLVATEHHTSQSLDLDVVVAGRARHVVRSKRHDQVSTAEALPEGGVALAWTTSRQHEVEDGQERAFDLVVSGRSYVVRGRRVTGEGGEVVGEEAALVLQGADVFDNQRALRRMLGSGSLRVGDTVAAGPLFGGMLADAPGPVAVAGTLELTDLRSVDGEACGVFRLAVEMSSSGPSAGLDLDVTATLTGEIAVGVRSGWTRSLAVAGPVSVVGSGPGTSVTGRGEMSVRTTFRFIPPG